MRTIKIKVTPKLSRIDQYLAHEIKDLSRSRIKKLIEQENILLNNRATSPSHKPVKGDTITVELPPPKSTEVLPEDLPLKIVFEDRDIIVIDKEAGMVIHPTLDHPSGTLVNALLFHTKNMPKVGEDLRPGIVHRLDKGTSGLMVAAKNETSLEPLKKQFRDRVVIKKYICLVQGRMGKSTGTINAPIARHKRNRMKFTVDDTGKEAVTNYRLISRVGDTSASSSSASGRPRRDWSRGGYSLLEVEPKTGRTHQIRVHLSHVEHPIVGDKLYGGKAIGKRQFLHASYLEFTHPGTNKKISFESKLPDDLQTTLDKIS